MLKTLNTIYKERIEKNWVTINGHPVFLADKEGETKDIPSFKNTEEALAYGKRIANDPERIKRVETEHTRLLAGGQKAIAGIKGKSDVKSGQWNALSVIITRTQLLREALQSAKATQEGKDPEESIKRTIGELKEDKKDKE